MMSKEENTQGIRSLDPEELDAVSGGLAGKTQTVKNTVDAVCGYCGTKGKHLMLSARTAQCSACGKTINLIGQ